MSKRQSKVQTCDYCEQLQRKIDELSGIIKKYFDNSSQSEKNYKEKLKQLEEALSCAKHALIQEQHSRFLDQEASAKREADLKQQLDTSLLYHQVAVSTCADLARENRTIRTRSCLVVGQLLQPGSNLSTAVVNAIEEIIQEEHDSPRDVQSPVEPLTKSEDCIPVVKKERVRISDLTAEEVKTDNLPVDVDQDEVLIESEENNGPPAGEVEELEAELELESESENPISSNDEVFGPTVEAKADAPNDEVTTKGVSETPKSEQSSDSTPSRLKPPPIKPKPMKPQQTPPQTPTTPTPPQTPRLFSPEEPGKPSPSSLLSLPEDKELNISPMSGRDLSAGAVSAPPTTGVCDSVEIAVDLLRLAIDSSNCVCGSCMAPMENAMSGLVQLKDTVQKLTSDLVTLQEEVNRMKMRAAPPPAPPPPPPPPPTSQPTLLIIPGKRRPSIPILPDQNPAVDINVLEKLKDELRKKLEQRQKALELKEAKDHNECEHMKPVTQRRADVDLEKRVETIRKRITALHLLNDG